MAKARHCRALDPTTARARPVVSSLVSFSYVRPGSPGHSRPCHRRSQTATTHGEHGPTDLESVWVASVANAACERPSNQVSNNRHRQQWTPTDADGQSFPGQARRSAGSRHRNLASGRRGQDHDRQPQDLAAMLTRVTLENTGLPPPGAERSSPELPDSREQ
jgi:hypothetical protein